MSFVFHMMLCVVFVVLQTVIFPASQVFYSFFDLFIPVIIYLGLFGSLRESVPVLVVLGMVMDSMSGAPFGVYLSCYGWLFVIVFWFKGFLHIHSYALLSLIVFLGVLLENIMLLLVANVVVGEWQILQKITRELFVQLSTAAILGPFIILYTKKLYEKASQTLGQFKDDF